VTNERAVEKFKNSGLFWEISCHMQQECLPFENHEAWDRQSGSEHGPPNLDHPRINCSVSGISPDASKLEMSAFWVVLGNLLPHAAGIPTLRKPRSVGQPFWMKRWPPNLVTAYPIRRFF
jgi:hypothetical protein